MFNSSYANLIIPLRLTDIERDEPSSFESLDSKSRMLLINLPLGKIDNEPLKITDINTTEETIDETIDETIE